MLKSKNKYRATKRLRSILNGKSVGLLDSKDDLLALVDDKQQEIKDKYNVEKVYPPATLKTIEKQLTVIILKLLMRYIIQSNIMNHLLLKVIQ